MSLIASGVMAYILACVAADLIVKLPSAWRRIMALRPARPRWEDDKSTPDLNVLASGKRLEVLPPEYMPPIDCGSADRRWRTQELRTEQKRSEW